MQILHRLKPAVPRRGLYLLAAASWGVAGILLAWRGWEILGVPRSPVLPVLVGGIIAGIVFFRYLFRRIADRVIGRIRSMPNDRPCLFSFLDWRGYGMMAGMITLGLLLRTTGVIPPFLLAPLYLMMSVALLASSLRFAAVGVRG